MMSLVANSAGGAGHRFGTVRTKDQL